LFFQEKKMKKNVSFIACAALSLCAGLASATPVGAGVGGYGMVNDSTMTYFGSASPNDQGWTTSTNNNIQVGIRVKDRGTFANFDGADGVYEVPQGLCAMPSCGTSPKARWNYEMFVNLNADGNHFRNFNGFGITMFVDTNPLAATSFTGLNFYTNWSDNLYFDGTNTSTHTGGLPSTSDFMAVQSVNPLFPNSGFNFLPGPGLYDLRMEVYENNSNDHHLVAGVSTQVQVIPEPSTLALVPLGLVGLAVMRKKKLGTTLVS
jgi:hypothetical protein